MWIGLPMWDPFCLVSPTDGRASWPEQLSNTHECAGKHLCSCCSAATADGCSLLQLPTSRCLPLCVTWREWLTMASCLFNRMRSIDSVFMSFSLLPVCPRHTGAVLCMVLCCTQWQQISFRPTLPARRAQIARSPLTCLFLRTQMKMES